MRDMTANDIIKEFNRFYLDTPLEEEYTILGIEPGRRFKQTQFSELYKPLYVTLWVHALDIHLPKQSDTIRDTYLKGLKACYQKQKGAFERTMSLVIDYEAMLGDFSKKGFRFTAEQIIKKISRNKEDLASRAVNLGECMQKILARLEKMVEGVRFVE